MTYFNWDLLKNAFNYLSRNFSLCLSDDNLVDTKMIFEPKSSTTSSARIFSHGLFDNLKRKYTTKSRDLPRNPFTLYCSGFLVYSELVARISFESRIYGESCALQPEEVQKREHEKRQ